MASEIRVDKITSLSGVGTITPSPTGIDIAGITTAATLRATTGIVTSLTSGSLTSLGDVDIADTIVHTGDTNTKIRFPAADTVTVETGGSEAIRVDSSQNFGVGTNSPTARLDVRRGDADGKIAEFHTSTGFGIDIGSSQTLAYISSGNAQNWAFKTDPGSGQTERLRITSAGQVLVGISTAATTQLVVYGDGTSDNKPAILFQNDLTGTGNSQGIFVGGNHDDQVGYLWNYESHPVVIGTSNNERLRISAVGNASLGLSADAVPTASSYNGGTLHLHQSTSGSYGSQIKMTTAAGGATAGDGFYIAHWGGNSETFLYNKENTAIRFGTNSAERFVIKNDGDVSITDGNLIIGTSGHGIDFSATGGPQNGTGSSELLDDYEEGTFTPSFDGFNSIEQQNTEWTGHYTKIGEMVFCDFYARFTSGGATSSNGSSIRLTGLPFGIENTARVRGGGVTSYQNIASSSHSGIWSWYGSQNNTYATAYVGASNVTAANGAGQAGKYIIGTFSYQAKP